MHKFVLLFCLFLLLGCSNDRVLVKHIDSKATDEIIASGLHFLYGGGYRLVKNEEGFAVETVEGLNPDLEWNELYTNSEFTIYYEPVIDNNDREVSRIYYYKSDEKKEKFFEFEILEFNDMRNYSYPHVYELSGQVYFTHVEDNKLKIQEIKNGELIDYEDYLIHDKEFYLEFLLIKKNEKFLFYTSDKLVKYVVDEGCYEFSKDDWVIILDDYIVYSTFLDDQLQGSYLITRQDGKVRQLDKSINVLKIDECTNPMHIDENRFLFEEINEGKLFYAYAEVDENQIQISRLPLNHNGLESMHGWYSFFSDTEIVICPTNPKDGTFSYHVITLE